MKLENVINTNLIENYIKENNLSKSGFCGICKISYHTFTKILNNENFDIIALFKIARVMQIHICNLFNN